jgi:hypothetical protein
MPSTSNIAAHGSQVASERGAMSLSRSFSDRLWIQLEKSLLAKPMLPPQAFVKDKTLNAAQSESDDILELDNGSPKRESVQINTDDDGFGDSNNDGAMRNQEFTPSIEHISTFFEDSGLTTNHERCATDLKHELLLYEASAVEQSYVGDHM